jgi:AcrR family transcriptional regulator
MQIVVEHGVEFLSIREIAKRIDYSPSGLYEYFSSKEAIIDELINEGFARLAAHIEQGVLGETALLRLQEAGRMYMHFAVQEPQLYLMMFNHRNAPSLSLADIEQVTAYAQLTRIVKDGLRSGEFHATNGAGWRELAYTSWSLMHGLSMLRLTLMNQINENVESLNERAFQVFLDQLK